MVQGSGSGFRVQGSGIRVQGSGFRVQGSGFRVILSGFRVQDTPTCRGRSPDLGWKCKVVHEGRRGEEPLHWRAECDPKAKMLYLQSFLRKGVSLGYVGQN